MASPTRGPYDAPWPISVGRCAAQIRRERGLQFDPEPTAVLPERVPRLQSEGDDCDALVAEDARRPRFIRVRREIAAALERSDPAASLSDPHR